MCGISGYYGKKNINLKTVNSTIELMKNRGQIFQIIIKIILKMDYPYIYYTHD